MHLKFWFCLPQKKGKIQLEGLTILGGIRKNYAEAKPHDALFQILNFQIVEKPVF